MAGEAPDLGDAAFAGALTGILAALTGNGAPTQRPIPVAPTITRPPPGLGIPLSTLAILLVGAFVVFQILK